MSDETRPRIPADRFDILARAMLGETLLRLADAEQEVRSLRDAKPASPLAASQEIERLRGDCAELSNSLGEEQNKYRIATQTNKRLREENADLLKRLTILSGKAAK